MSATEPRRAARSTESDAGAGFRTLLAEFRERHDRALEAFLEEKGDAMPGPDSGRDLASALLEFVQTGGKRIRPALTYYAYRASGGAPAEDVLPMALSTELLHTYLLVHDDIMDRSDLRRGEPTAHVRFRDAFRGNGAPDAAEHFGRSAAILLGDLAHTWAVELFQRARPRAGDGRPALDRAFSGMCEEVISGQYMEIVLPHREIRDVDEETLLGILRLKSGRYTVERPVELGTLLAGGDLEDDSPMAVYGRSLGEAFQLQDDLLGTFGDEDRAGKPGGVDLIEGKITVLVHRALLTSSEEDGRRLRRVLEDPSPTQEEVDGARDVIRRSGALEHVRGMIEERFDRAEAAARDAGLEGPARTFFDGLIDYLRGRQK